MLLRLVTILLLLLVLQAGVQAQICVDDYYVKEYATSTVQNPMSATVTPQNDILVAGAVLRKGSVKKDGWLTKFSPQGTVLWSRSYTSIDFNYIHFNKAIPSGDGYLVVGNIGNVDTTVSPPAVLTQYGLLVKVNKNGNLEWYKMFGRAFLSEKSTDFNNIIAAPSNDFLIVANYSGLGATRNLIVRINDKGDIKWTTAINFTNEPAFMGALHIQQLHNGQVLLANRISFMDPNAPWIVTKEGYFTANIDFESGTSDWQRTYIFSNSASTRARSFGSVVNISSLPNGDLSFIASYADTAYIYFRDTKKVINFITDNVGRLINAKAFYGPPPLYASAAAQGQADGEQVLLLDNSDAPYLVKLNASGDIVWQHAYPLIGRSQETRALLGTENGYYFFSFTHNGGSKDLKLVKTDMSGNANCVQQPVNFVTQDINTDFRMEAVNPTFEYNPGTWYGIASLFDGPYSMTEQVICRNVCCKDTVVTAPPIDLCNVDSYTLPNNEVVSAPGTYSVTYKSFKGCDSIVQFTVAFSKKPVVNLGDDACLEGKDSVILKTEAGYSNYNWMGSNSTNNSLVVKTPGKYSVSVANGCGTVADTVEVFDKCDFGIYVPNAFTPNGDNRNDFFGLPNLNKNRFIDLKIYNRWGQLIFQTSEIEKRWDGTIKGNPAPPGIYIYMLTMESLTGKRLMQKGTINLVR